MLRAIWNRGLRCDSDIYSSDMAEVDGWLGRRQSREVRREILGHLKICRRCRQWVKYEADDKAFESWLITHGSTEDIS